jgi:hypothetical protein
MTIGIVFLIFSAVCFLLGGIGVDNKEGKPTTAQWQCFGWFFLVIWLIMGALPK